MLVLFGKWPSGYLVQSFFFRVVNVRQRRFAETLPSIALVRSPKPAVLATMIFHAVFPFLSETVNLMMMSVHKQ